MKKRIAYFILAMLLVCSLSMPCFADDTGVAETTVVDVAENATTTPEETATAEPTETLTEPEKQQGEQTPEADSETPTEGADLTDELAQIKDMVEKLSEAEDMSEIKELISSSSIWVIAGAGILIILSVCGIVKNKFGVIITAFNTILGFFGKDKNEDGEPTTFKDEFKNVKEGVVKELTDAFKEEIGKYKEELEAKEHNEQVMCAMFTLFLTNCKIPETAKTELLNMATGIKQYEGTAQEIIEQAQAVIDAATTEEVPTPTLDEIVAEEYMELG